MGDAAGGVDGLEVRGDAGVVVVVGAGEHVLVFGAGETGAGAEEGDGADGVVEVGAAGDEGEEDAEGQAEDGGAGDGGEEEHEGDDGCGPEPELAVEEPDGAEEEGGGAEAVGEDEQGCFGCGPAGLGAHPGVEGEEALGIWAEVGSELEETSGLVRISQERLDDIVGHGGWEWRLGLGVALGMEGWCGRRLGGRLFWNQIPVNSFQLSVNSYQLSAISYQLATIGSTTRRDHGTKYCLPGMRAPVRRGHVFGAAKMALRCLLLLSFRRMFLPSTSL
jgi:hypothetical protein